MGRKWGKKKEWAKPMSLYADLWNCFEVFFEIGYIRPAQSYQLPACQLQIIVTIEAGFERAHFCDVYYC